MRTALHASNLSHNFVPITENRMLGHDSESLRKRIVQDILLT